MALNGFFDVFWEMRVWVLRAFEFFCFKGGEGREW